MDGWIDVVWMDGCMDGWLYGWMYRCCMDGWLYGWMDRCCMDGWIYIIWMVIHYRIVIILITEVTAVNVALNKNVVICPYERYSRLVVDGDKKYLATTVRSLCSDGEIKINLFGKYFVDYVVLFGETPTNGWFHRKFHPFLLRKCFWQANNFFSS